MNEHLATPFLTERPAARQVVKLLAAFPTDGAPPEVLRANGLWEAAQELQRLTQGEIVLTVGGGRDDQGREVPFALALRGLEPTTGIASDWLTSTLREFSRYHVDTSDRAIERAERAFARLLTAEIFREPHWKVVERVERRLTDSPGLLLEGSFSGTARRFPERRVHIRLLRDGEAAKGAREADFTFDIVLGRHVDRDEADRRSFPGVVVRDDDRGARLELNLFHRALEQYYADLQATLQPVMNPWQVSPLLMLALHEAIEEKRRGQLVPKDVDREIEHVFQPALFGHSADELFNTDLGTALGARGPRVMEELFRALCEERFPSYQTLMRQPQGWQASLRDYETALERLPSRHERQGATTFEGTKEEVARLFNRANVGFDSFKDNYPELIELVKEFKGKNPGTARFRLHPFEQHLRALLQRGDQVDVRQAGKTLKAHVVKLDLVYHAGGNLGYRRREVDALLALLAKRELTEVSTRQNLLLEVVQPTLSVEDLRKEAASFTDRVTTLLATFPDEAQLSHHLQVVRQLQETIKQRAGQEERSLLQWSTGLRGYDKQLAAFLQQKQESLRQAAREMAEAAVPDPVAAFKLREPITGAFFGPGLDVVRDKLLEQADTVRARADDTKTRALEVLSDLRADVPSDDVICRAHAALATLREQTRRSGGESSVLEARCGHLATAKHALQRAVDLDHQLTMGPVGHDDRPDLGEALAALVRTVQADLSRNKMSAIEHASSWEADLTALRNRLNRLQSEQLDAFEKRKGRYVELLRRFAHVPADVAPLPATFNFRDSDGSERMLATQVKQVLGHGLERPLVLLEQWGEGMRQILASGDLAYVDDPSGQEQFCRDLLHEVAARTESMVAVRREIDDDTVIQDVATADGRFVQLMRGYEALAVDVARLGSRYQALAAVIRTRRLDPQEETFMDALERLVDGDRTAVDLGAVLNNPAAYGTTNAEEVWSAVQRLYKKRRIGIRLALTQPTEA